MTGLPTGWVLAPLNDLLAGGVFSDGDWVETKDQDPAGDVRLTQLADIGDGSWRDKSRRRMSSSRAKALACTYLEKDDVLVARMPEPLGRACLFPGDPDPCVTVIDVAICRPSPGSVDPKWLMHFINTPAIRAEIGRRQSGTTRKRISRSNLASLSIPVPPLGEQKRIVEELDRRFSHIQAARAGLTSASLKSVRLRWSIFEAVANGALLELDPVGWESFETGEVTDVKGGIQKQPKRKPVNNVRPFLRVANVGRAVLDLSEVHQIEVFEGEDDTYRLLAGDLLVVEGNGSVEQIGRAATWDGSISNCFHQNHLIRVRPRPALDPRFLELVWNAPSTVAQLRSVASSTSGLHTLSVSKVKRVRLRVPPLPVQEQLVAEADRRLSILQPVHEMVLQNQNQLNRLTRALLTSAITGRLVAQDPLDEPAEHLLKRIREAAGASPVRRLSANDPESTR